MSQERRTENHRPDQVILEYYQRRAPFIGDPRSVIAVKTLAESVKRNGTFVYSPDASISNDTLSQD